MKSREVELTYLYLIFDLCVLNFAILLIGWWEVDIHVRDFNQLWVYILHSNLSWFITYFVFTKRNLFLRDNYRSRVLRVTKRQLVFYLVSASVLGIMATPNFNMKYFVYYSLVFYGIRIVTYYFVYKYLKYKRSKGLNTLPALIIGCNETGSLLRQIIECNPMFGYRFAGFVCNRVKEHKNLLGTIEQLDKLIDAHNIRIVFITFSFFNDDAQLITRREVLNICNQKGIRLRLVPKPNMVIKGGMSTEKIGGLTAFNPQEIPLDYVGARLLKRAFDIVFSGLVILLLFSWLFPILGIIIKINSKGPVFFKQMRTGYNNHDFLCLKFRSMKVNNDANSKQATKDDDRITSVGRFLRKTNMDELPQFINVFMGDMSVVGPRPHMLKHTEEYSELIKNYLVRHYVKPGITGWAQVRGYRGETRELTAMEKRVKADMEYMMHWHIFKDINIIWQTVFGKAAYKNAG